MKQAIRMNLREYQKLVITELYQLLKLGLTAVLIYAPTGAGKTVVACQIILDALSRGRRVLFLVHRAKLIKQTFHTLLTSGIKASVIYAEWEEEPDYDNPVQIAMVQTLQNRELPPDIGVVIADEVHTTAYYKLYHERVVPTYGGKILALSKCYFIGLTASPWRTKSTEGYCHLFQAVVRAPYPQQLIEMGYLAASRQFGYDGLIDFRKLDTGSNGEYTQTSMQKVCDRKFNTEVVRHYMEKCPERKAIIFCAGVEQTIDLANSFQQRGIAAECIIEDTTEKERDSIFERFHTGITHILISVYVLCEGFDEKSVQAVLLARPTKSRALLVQMCGRGLRTDTENGKEDCWFLDFCENFKRLGIHTSKYKTSPCPRICFGKGKQAEEETLNALKTCFKCNSLVPAGLSICPECGYVFQKKEKPPAPPRPFGEILSKEQTKAAKWLRKYLHDAYWRELHSVTLVDSLFAQHFKYSLPEAWCQSAIFGGSFKMLQYHQQLYIRFLRKTCTNPDSESAQIWIIKQMWREFGAGTNHEYKPWWRIMGMISPTIDIDYIKQEYRIQAQRLANYTHAQEALALLDLAICEALSLEIQPGTLVNWTDCPLSIDWMQPFKIITINHNKKTAELEGVYHPVPIDRLMVA
jgi:superfamily II DNA or RNA helicase